MKNYLRGIVVCLVVACSTGLTAQLRETKMALRGSRAEAEATFRQIAQATSLSERKQLFAGLSLEMKGDVWLLHYHDFLQRHPELTFEQRDLVMEMVGMIASDLPGELDGIADVASEARAQRFLVRAKAGLPRELFAEAFAQVGPRSNLAIERPQPRSIHADSPGGSVFKRDCNCNKNWDFCNTLTNTDPYCKALSCYPSNFGCGLLWLNSCNSLCGAMPD